MDKAKLTLMLDQTNIHNVLKIFRKYGKELPYKVYSTVDQGVDYQVQWSQPGEPTMLLTYSYGGGDIINIHYEPHGFALLNKKSDVPFDWSVRLNPNSKDLFETVKKPKDYISALWLKQYGGHTGFQNETNEMFLILLFLVARCVLTWFGFGLEMMNHGKDELWFKPKKDFLKLASEGYENMKEKVRVEHLYDGCDTVTMDEKQFQKMAEYVDEVGMDMNLETISLDKFIFRFVKKDGLAEAYCFTALDGGLMIVVDSERPKTKRFSFAVLLNEKVDPDTGEVGYDSELKTDVSCGENEIEWLNTDTGGGITNWQWLVYSFFGINTFMLNYRDVSVDVKEIECKQSEKVSHGSKVKERTVVKMFRHYTLKKDWKRAVARKKAEYHCLAWSVRGHFRTLRDGRKIFVRPYIKGKEKDKYVPKDYIPIPSDV